MADPATPRELQVRPLAGFNPAPFGADSIVLAPVLSSAGRGADAPGVERDRPPGDHEEAAERAAEHTGAAALPGPQRARLLAREARPRVPELDTGLELWAGNAPTPPSESAWITGLWERGHGFDCDVYHPTGACLMNVFTYDVAANKSFQFCWVCRYTLVDTIDPTKHGAVDKALKYRYPT